MEDLTVKCVEAEEVPHVARIPAQDGICICVVRTFALDTDW
jgi:hypothetical protein